MSMQPNWFSLFKNNDNIEEGISEEFINILKKCKNPHIICIYGDARTGKSTKMNQIINGINANNYFNLNQPFKTLREIHTTMTKGCNFYGPIKIEDIASKNDIDIGEINRQIINDELFFVDTEGLKTIDNTTKSCVSGILTVLQIASIKILYTPFLDNEKFEDAVKNTKLSSILNLFTNESKIIVLMRDIQVKETKNEGRISAELKHQKSVIENKINNYFQNIDGNINAICEILPSFDLASNDVEPFPSCYKQQMVSLVFSILTNINHNNEMTGEKLLEIIKELLEIFKKVKNIELMKNTENALNSILLELYKEKVNEVYKDICDKIDKFDKNIISLNGKKEALKNYLIENIKNKLKNTWEIYEKTIHDEIFKQLETIIYKLEGDIKTILEKEKDKINNEIYSIIDINKNNEIKNYLSQIEYKEQIDQNILKEMVNNAINYFMNKYKSYFEYTDVVDQDYKNKVLDQIKTCLNTNLDYIIMKSKPEWKDSLGKLIFRIQTEISNPYKNDLIKQSIEEINIHLNNDLDTLRKKIQIFIADNGIKIYKVEDLNKELNNIYETIKQELLNQIKLIKNETTLAQLQKEKLLSKSIPNGIYLIYAAHCQNKVLDICGGSKEDNARLQLYDFNDTNAQKFYISYNISGKFYTIKCLCSDKFITRNDSTNTLVQFSEKNNKSQQWHIVPKEDRYEIISEFNGKLIDVYGSQTECGADIVTLERNGGLNQQFNLVSTTKTIPPPPPPPKEEIKMGGGCVPHPQVSYFPIPNFHHPYSDRNSIVDALKSIGVDSSLQYRAKIGARNGIPGRAGQASYNTHMLNLLKSGKLIIP